ncbi:MAG: orotidine-5'-phosphate decarboxylase [Opitutales bacterium]|nr:orotidine-5'-phosphate decarboxylase [Opitutales bacterium]
MTFSSRWKQAGSAHGSLLCVGLDPELERLPSPLRQGDDPFFAFGQAIIDATAPFAAAFKPQFAHFAGQGQLSALVRLCHYIRRNYPQHLLILDAKRGDIGSTADHYAREAFAVHDADAVTVNPYMGGDTLEPFTRDPARGIFVLCKTSNPGSGELQGLRLEGGRLLFEEVAARAAETWSRNHNVGLVVGATYPEELAAVRRLAPDLPILVPGIGAQGGDLAATLRAGLRPGGDGLFINASRSILYASGGPDFATAAAAEAKSLRDAINALRP